ncbi:hypothetical protein F4777DRAFT_580057 [Nemania sp. FL0916]|nr:hypothetical protein F4777DRAFT_580057 [Nemania sp. FL0916]
MTNFSIEHAAPSMLSYKYEPLPQGRNGERWIRVLDLLPSTENEAPIRVCLRTVLLKENVHYDAVSYVWGDMSTTETVLVRDDGVSGLLWKIQTPTLNITNTITDSETEFRPKQIRTNLVDGLRVLRMPDRERTLWIDALCINQDDRDERSQQVGFMGLIFWLAECVLVWLGPDEKGIAAKVIKYMQPISAAYFHSNDRRPRSQEEAEALDADVWSGIAELYRNPWFERVWVQQEVGLARHCRFFWGDKVNCCHHDVLGFDLWLETAGQQIVNRFNMDRGVLKGTRSHWISYGRSTREAWADDRQNFISQRPFLVTLIEGARCKASDPRDHVYAFLGHPAARRHYAYRPEQKINYLKLVEDGEDTLVQPDYNKTVDEVFLETAIALFNQQHDMRVLGAVRHTEESLARDYPSWVPRWDMLKDQQPIGAIPFESSPAIVLDGFPVTWHIDRRTPTDCIRASCTLFGLTYQTIDRLFDFNDGSGWLQRHISGRRFFRTKSEEDGLAPIVAKPGDIVVLMLVSYAPCILRHVKGNEYKFVGTC